MSQQQSKNIMNIIIYIILENSIKKNIPKDLPRISDEELSYKKKEINIYQSVIKTIYKLWYHMLPYENLILASKWKNQN